MMTEKNIRIALIIIASIYFITVIERTLLKKDSSTEIMIEHASEKIQMNTKIEFLTNKIHNYELEILKINSNIDDLSNDQLDSAWTKLFDSR